MAKRSSKKSILIIRRTILTVISLAMLTVVIATICIFIFKPENVVKSKISDLSSNYYENFLYKNIISSEAYLESKDLNAIMEKYKETGFAAVTLRQLILFGTQKDSDLSSLLKEYCNENETSVKFYPEAPYTQSSYRTEYAYSCNF